MVLVFAAALLAGTPRAAQAIVPPGFVNEVYASGFSLPVQMVFDSPTGRMFVAEKGGRVRVHVGGTTLATPVIDLTDEVHNAGDKGLLSIALDPNFATNSYLYLLYAVDPVFGQPDEPEESIVFGRLTRYTLIDNVADPGSRLVLLGNDASNGLPSCAITHSIGTLRFGFDGSLLLSCGDGAHPEFVDGGQNILPNDPVCDSTFGPNQNLGSLRSQSLLSMAGKILRLDPATGLGLPSNPFWDGNPDSFASRVWVRGLRNPFRFNLRPGSPSPGTLYICDVGWHAWEELNIAYGGENMGWPCWEGVPPQQGYYFDEPITSPTCQAIATPSVTPPAISWNHSNPNPIGFVGNASTGVSFYTGTSYPPQYQGACFFADLGQHWMKVATVDAADQVLSIAPFGEVLNFPVCVESHPGNGDIMYISIVEGTVRRIRYTIGNFPPTAVAGATPTSGTPPLAVQFSSDGTEDPNNDPLTFDWDFGDGSPHSAAPNPSHTYSTSGNFTARLIVTDTGSLADTATVSIVTTNAPPTVAIQNPLHGFVFTPNDPILLSADGWDPESGSNLTWFWDILLIHNEHVHPGWFNSTEPNPFFTPSDHGGPGDRTSYRIKVTVTDPGGLAASDSVVIVPPSLGQNASPVAQFSPSVTQGEAPLAVFFNASESVDPDLDLLDFSWDFGDGTTGSGETTTHFFSTHGLFRVKLLVSDPFLGVDTTSCAVFVEPAGQLASWSFDEGAGTTVQDATTNDRDGTLTGGGATWVPGIFGNAINFLGTDTEMTTGLSFLSNRSAFTITAWLRPNSLSALTGIVGQNDAVEMGFDSPTMFDIWTPGGGEVLHPYTFPVNAWHHAASTGSGSQLRIYYDGAVVASDAHPTSNYGSSSYHVKVGGGIYDATGGFFDGAVDEVRIYGRALSASEVAFLATAPPANAPPLVEAGADITTTVNTPVALFGTVSDDGFPAPPGQTSILWTQQSGPAAASIFNPGRRFTYATFPAPGEYILDFEADDGGMSSTDALHITVTDPTPGPHVVVAPIREGLAPPTPNPMRSHVNLEFGIRADFKNAQLAIHDVSGRRVATIVDQGLESKNYRLQWDGRNDAGHAMATGIYFAVLTVDDRRYTKKVALLR